MTTSSMQIFPTSFNTCTLRCSLKENLRRVMLNTHRTRETRYVEVGFTDSFLALGDVAFQGDLMEARDCGPPYLILYDIIEFGKNPIPAAYLDRLEAIRAMLSDPLKLNSHSEFRISVPDLFDVKDIGDVFEYVLPNYRGIALGVAFVGSTIEPPTGSRIELDAVDCIVLSIHKTGLPEVYELFSEENQKLVADNNIAYIPTIKVAKYVKHVLGNKPSARMKFQYNAERRKWTPKLPPY